MSEITKTFLNWCGQLKIVSKEKGLMSFAPSSWFTGQKYLVQQIFEEIEKNSHIREFIILKARQLGVTSILNAIDLFWVMKFPAVRLAFLCHNYEARPKLRQNLRTLYLSLPRTHKVPAVVDNREMMHFANRSEILFFHVSTREATRQAVARSQAVTCIHATEAAYYDSVDPAEEVLKSLQISCAKTHPARFVILESTANGYNSFYDRWQNALSNPAQKAIFIAWWMRDDYRLSSDHPLFHEYSYPPDRLEKQWIKAIKEDLGFGITKGQLAWWRNELMTTYNGDLNFCLQELPWLPDDAFRLSGYKFFDSMVLTRLRKEVQNVKPLYLDISVDNDRITISEGSTYKANFEVYELPQVGERYFIGADPSFGSSPDSDAAVISIWKGYGDKIVQVAEFCDNNVGPIEFAKLLVFLSCFYNPSHVNLEVQGPGKVVIKEMDKIKQGTIEIGDIRISNTEYDIARIRENLRSVKEYLYYRPDSLHRSHARHWVSTAETKEMVMNQMRSIVHLGMIEIKSKNLVEEMSYFVKSGSSLGAEAGRHDDRVIAAAIALEFWRTYWSHRLPKSTDVIKPEEKTRNRTFLEQTGLINVISPFLQGVQK